MPSQAILISPDKMQSEPKEGYAVPGRGDAMWTTLVSSSITNSDSLSAGIITCRPYHGLLAPHTHAQAEIYIILSGEGVVTVDGKRFDVAAGGMLYIPGGAVHGVQNLGERELRWIWVFPTSDFNDIVYKFEHEKEA